MQFSFRKSKPENEEVIVGPHCEARIKWGNTIGFGEGDSGAPRVRMASSEVRVCRRGPSTDSDLSQTTLQALAISTCYGTKGRLSGSGRREED